MNVVALAQLAIQSGAAYSARVAQLAISGELNARHLWYGIEGAAEYAKAVASGDFASDHEIDERRMTCAQCPSRQKDERFPKRLGHCGPRFEDNMMGVLPTCGCPLEAVTAVGSKACPQGKW